MSDAATTTTIRNFFRVLVIDDNPVDREITARHLGKAWPFERELSIDYEIGRAHV